MYRQGAVGALRWPNFHGHEIPLNLQIYGNKKRETKPS